MFECACKQCRTALLPWFNPSLKCFSHKTNMWNSFSFFLGAHTSKLFCSVPGLQGSDQEREELKGRLQLAETRAEELAESLRAATSSMEQYRAMAQSLEQSLETEKQVRRRLDRFMAL